MKIFYTSIILLILSTNVFAKIELYTLDDQTPHPVSEMYTLLNNTIEKYPEKNILFYVHGRKRNVIDEINKIPKIESAYNVKVIMLHWDSYDTLVSRPTANAEKTADSLHDAFEAIRLFRLDNPEFFEKQKINLLCHSMGNLVLKYTVEKYYKEDTNQDKLFTNYIGVGADVPMNTHASWLENFHLAGQNYIMMNNRDIVLLLSYLLDIKERQPLTYKLGLGFDNYPTRKQDIKNKIASNVLYIDLSDVLVSDHGYYISKDKIMKNIFNKLLNGEYFYDSKKGNEHFKVKQDKKGRNIFYVSK
jgi:esterase/lipase superfamily enzyme